MKSWQFSVMVGLALIALFCFVRILDPVGLKVLRLKTFDQYQIIQPREPANMPVYVIDLDDDTLQKYGQWPWPRTLIAELVDKLKAAGAGVVGFDIVFPEPDRTSPANIVDLYRGLDPAARQALLAMPDSDLVFAKSLASMLTVLGQSTTSQASAFNEGRPPAIKAMVAWKSVTPPLEGARKEEDFLLPNPGITRNLQVLEDGTKGLGIFNIDADVDQIVRNVPLLFRDAEKTTYTTLSAEMLRVALGVQNLLVRWHGRNGLEDVVYQLADGQRIIVPTDERGRVWLHFVPWNQARQTQTYIPAKDVLDGTVEPGRLKNSMVIVGTSAVGLLDIKATPLYPFVPGVDIHAQLLECMLLYLNEYIAKKGDRDAIDSPFLHRPNDADFWEVGAILVTGLALMFAVPLIGAVWSLLIALAAIGAQIGAGFYAFSAYGALYDLAFPAVTSFVLYTALTYINYVREQAQKRQVRTAFAQYLSPALVEQLADHPEQLRLGGERRGMTIMFSDIRGFTSISESFKTDPEGLVRLINRYLTPMTDLIMSKGGTIDKYMGDAIMAFWNAPITDDDHARHACDTALAMQAKTRELNAALETEAKAAGRRFVPINIGVGVNSGEVFVGNMGSDQRFDYSVIGDDVNLASRLEGQSKTYGVGIVIGENTKARADDFALLELDLIQVKGKAEAVRVFTVLGDPERGRTPEFQALAARHGDLLAAYRRQDWASARAMVADCRRLDGALSNLYDLYGERIEIYERNPPGPDWDGVFVATTK